MISVRGSREALEAASGGAHLVDVENPISVLGTQYPLNILAVRNRLYKMGFEKVLVSTNIGSKPYDRALACQAALGVAAAGADVVKCGLAELPFKAAVYLGDSLVRTVKRFYPEKRVIPVVYVEPDMRRFFDPLEEGVELATQINADGLQLDTHVKTLGKGLLDYYKLEELARLAETFHAADRALWVSGGITREQLPGLWDAGLDVAGIRSAAREQSGRGPWGEVKADLVGELTETIPAAEFAGSDA